VTNDPFAALGLPARPDLDDETVRAAWRHIAAATHPDRPDGGDLARYTAASAAYAQLRTPWGRSETYADLTAHPGYGHQPSGDPGTAPMPAATGPGPRPALPLTRLYAILMIPERIRHGRPLRLVIRGAIAAAVSLAVLRAIPGQPAAPAIITGATLWFLLTGRSDLAPPPGR
jgi:hypothetical protein